MNWTRLFNRLTGTRRGHEQDLDEELTFHQEMKRRQFAAQGMTPDAARDAARKALGNLTLAREDARAQWTFSWIGDLGRDLRYAVRTLAAQPAFAIAAVLALVLGIGVNAILFNIYNALALSPWAVRDAAHVVRLTQQEAGSGQWNGFPWPAYRYLRDHSTTFTAITAFDTMSFRITRRDQSWMAEGIAADENFFNVLGTGFAAGRGFSPSNGNLKEPAPEVVLHYDEWIRHYGGDRAVIGQWTDINGHRMQIVGVASEGFSGPVPVNPTLWIPAPWKDILHPGTASMDNADNCCARVVGRLKDGAGRNEAQAELNALAAQYGQDLKRAKSRILLSDLTLLADPRNKEGSAPAFVAVSIASLLILVLACANVANLQLARGVSRAREFSVRVSLGASRGRILRQLVVEAIVLSAVAGSLTALMTAWAPRAIMRAVASATNATNTLNFAFSNDWRVVVFVAAVSLLAALLFGLGPAWTASRNSMSAGLQEGGRATASGRVRKILLAIQVVLCTVLLSGASLLVRALDEAQHADPGFAAAQMIVVNPNLDSNGVSEAQTAGAADALRERIQTLPGVEAVTYAVVIPLGQRNDTVTTELPATHRPISFNFNSGAANFFDTMGIPIVAGRALNESEETRNDAVIVNETLAKLAWPKENPLGKALMGTRIVVGVVRDFHLRELGPAIEPAAFVPSHPTRDSQLIVRFNSSNNAQALAGMAVKAAGGMDRRLTMTTAEPYNAIIDRARQATILVAAIAGVLSTLALVLACVGIYGVAAYSVSQRTREIGVRMALGARPQLIARMVLGENIRVVLIGAALGIAGAIAFGRLLTSLLYGVAPGDPIALFSTILILLATAGASAWLPARRAASVDPAVTLRHD